MKKTYFFLLGIFFLVPGFVKAEIIFQDNFDSCTINCNCTTGGGVPTGWGSWQSFPYCELVTFNGVSHYPAEISSSGRGGGGKSLKVWRVGKSMGGYAGGLVKEIPDTNHLFNRFYMKLPSVWDVYHDSGNPGGLQKFIRWNVRNSPTEFFFGTVSPGLPGKSWFNDSTFEFFIPPGSHYLLLDATEWKALRDDKWHSWEFEIDIPGSTIRLWIDGNLKKVVNAPELASVGSVFRLYHWPLGNRSYTSPSDIWNHQNQWAAIETDDFVISTSYVGPDGSTTPGDTVPPLIPTGLKIE